MDNCPTLSSVATLQRAATCPKNLMNIPVKGSYDRFRTGDGHGHGSKEQFGGLDKGGGDGVAPEYQCTLHSPPHSLTRFIYSKARGACRGGVAVLYPYNTLDT